MAFVVVVNIRGYQPK